MANPAALRSTSISRRSPSTSRRNRMATSREWLRSPCNGPLRDRRSLERERGPPGHPTTRDEGGGNRGDPFLPRTEAPETSGDTQVRDQRRTPIPADERSRLALAA